MLYVPLPFHGALMRVHVTLYGELKRYVNSGKTLVDVAEGTTVGRLLDDLGVDRRQPRITAVNDDVVDESHVLADGDHLEVLHAVAGGSRRPARADR